MLDADDRTVSQIDPETRAVVRTFSTSSTPTDIAAGAGGVWIGSTTSDNGVFPSSVSRVDPESGLLVETVELPPTRILPAKHIPGEQPAAHRRRAGCRLGDQPRPHRLAHRPAIEPDRRAGREDAGREHRNGRRRRLGHRGQHRHRDRQRHERGRATPDARSRPGSSSTSRSAEARCGRPIPRVAGYGASTPAGDSRRGPSRSRRGSQVSPTARERCGRRTRSPTRSIASTRGRARSKRIATDASPRDVDAGADGVWVTTASPPSREAALPRAVCQEVQSGGVGRPDLLLVSSLPLQGASRAARAVDGRWDPFRSRAARVRGRRVLGRLPGVRLLDGAGGAEDFFRCGSNAKAFSRNERVVGVIGSFQSFCSYLQIPITNQAPGGPLVMISPSNTVEFLTEDDGLYPSGTRSFFRLAALGSPPGPRAGRAREGAGPRPALRARFG